MKRISVLLAIMAVSCSKVITLSQSSDLNLESAIARAQDCLQKGGGHVKVVIKEGEYHINDVITIDGRKWKHPEKSSLSIVGKGGVHISGSMKVDGWQNFNDSILVAEVAMQDPGDYLEDGNRFALYFNGKMQTPARWPDEGYRYWGTTLGNDRQAEAPHYSSEGYMGYKEDRVSRWANEQDPYMGGFFAYHWYWGCQKIESIDTLSKSLRFREPYHEWGYRDNCRIFGFNLFCELDSPGEYWYDKEKGLLYWYPPRRMQASDRVDAAIFNKGVIIEAESCTCLKLKNLSFEYSRSGVLNVNGGRLCIDNCRFAGLGDNVIDIHNGKKHIIESCVFEELSGMGIISRCGDRKTLESSCFTVRNCHFRDFGLFCKTYKPAIFFDGVGALITRNIFEKASSSAIRLNGNDSEISFNVFSSLVLESDDQGAIDMYMDYSSRGNIIKYNYFRDINDSTPGSYTGRAAIRFDDFISGQTVESNVFENCGSNIFGAVQINGGKDHHINGNLFYNCHYAISSRTMGASEWTDRKSLIQVYLDNATDIYKLKYPDFAKPFDENVSVNYAEGNLFVGPDEPIFDGEFLVQKENRRVDNLNTPVDTYIKKNFTVSFPLRIPR